MLVALLVYAQFACVSAMLSHPSLRLHCTVHTVLACFDLMLKPARLRLFACTQEWQPARGRSRSDSKVIYAPPLCKCAFQNQTKTTGNQVSLCNCNMHVLLLQGSVAEPATMHAQQKPRILTVPMPRPHNSASNEGRKGQAAGPFRSDRAAAQQQAASRTNPSQQKASGSSAQLQRPQSAKGAAEPQPKQAQASDVSVQVHSCCYRSVSQLLTQQTVSQQQLRSFTARTFVIQLEHPSRSSMSVYTEFMGALQVAAPAKPLGSWGSGVNIAQQLAQKERQTAAAAPAPAVSQAKPASQVGVSCHLQCC